MITLPTEPVPAVLDLSANNLLIEGDYGIGKSGLLASTGYLLADPEGKLRSYPGTLRVDLKSWEDHKDFVTQISKQPAGTFKGIGLDSLNVSYDHALLWTMKNVKFQGNSLTHPSENPQIAYPRITHEFITWLRSVTLLGYHVVATCHTNIAEIKDKKGNIYHRWIPAFTGGSSTSTYASVLKVFSLVGFMTIDEVEKPSAILRPATRNVMGKAVADTRADASRLDEMAMTRVIYFKQDPNWLANNKFGGFPDRVVLTDRWQDDWKIMQEAWGSGEAYSIAAEPVDTNILTGIDLPKEGAGLS